MFVELQGCVHVTGSPTAALLGSCREACSASCIVVSRLQRQAGVCSCHHSDSLTVDRHDKDGFVLFMNKCRKVRSDCYKQKIALISCTNPAHPTAIRSRAASPTGGRIVQSSSVLVSFPRCTFSPPHFRNDQGSETREISVQREIVEENTILRTHLEAQMLQRGRGHGCDKNTCLTPL